jgi:hypothetical protein
VATDVWISAITSSAIGSVATFNVADKKLNTKNLVILMGDQFDVILAPEKGVPYSIACKLSIRELARIEAAARARRDLVLADVDARERLTIRNTLSSNPV